MIVSPHWRRRFSISSISGSDAPSTQILFWLMISSVWSVREPIPALGLGPDLPGRASGTISISASGASKVLDVSLFGFLHNAPNLVGDSRGRNRVLLGPVHPVLLPQGKESLGETDGLGSGNLAGERHDAQAGWFMADGKAFLRFSFHGKTALLPPNRSFEFFSPPVDTLRNPEGRPRVSLRARSGRRILPEVEDLLIQTVLFDELLPGASPIRECQEGVEAHHGVGLTAGALAPHNKPRGHVRDGPESRPSRILVESKAALHTDGGDRNVVLEQLDSNGGGVGVVSSLHSVVSSVESAGAHPRVRAWGPA